MGEESGPCVPHLNSLLIMHPIIDAHVHLWLKQDTEWDGKKIKGMSNGRCMFLGEEVQMLPPYILDGRNTAEMLLSNMDYAQVSAAVVTQEFIDGLQNEYLLDVQHRYPQRLLCCGMPDTLHDGFVAHAERLIEQGFRALKIPAHRLILSDKRIRLTSDEMMRMFGIMQSKGIILSIDLAEGLEQNAEMEEVIQEFPDLKIAIGHFANANRPQWQEQMKLGRYKNVMIESCGITWLYNDEYYPYKGAVLAIKEAIDTIGADKVMWGSDYPRTIVAITYKMSYDFVVKSDLLTEREKAMFLGENAQRFYGFGELPVLPYIKNMSE